MTASPRQQELTTSGPLAFGTSGDWRLAVLPSASRPSVVGSESMVVEHRSIGSHHRHLVLAAPAVARSALPGQFLMLTAAHLESSVPVLPRPMAIYATDPRAGTVAVVYAVVGAGTKRLSEFAEGDPMYVVGPLGRGFDIPPATRSTLLIGRGIGTCSLTTVAQHNRRLGIDTVAVTSARTADSVVGADHYRAHGVSSVLEVSDEEGTSRPEALLARLTRLLDEQPPQLILTCGSRRLVVLCRNLAERWGATVQVSLEAPMACGLGYCHGCASGDVGDRDETPLVCKDGPVFALQKTA